MNASSLQLFGPEIWLADGPEVEVIGFRYPTPMAVILLSDGGLFIWSPVALSDALRRDLSDLGEVRHLVAPNSLHHLFLAEWRAAYPQAALYAPPGLRRRRKDLEFHAELGDAPPPEWTISIRSSCAAIGSRPKSSSSIGRAARSSSLISSNSSRRAGFAAGGRLSRDGI